MEYDSQHLGEAIKHFSRAGAAFSEFAEAFVAGAIEVFSYFSESLKDLSALYLPAYKACLPVWEVKTAIDNAPPKLKHYALYSKRYRIRKKYLDRILKEYQEKKEG